MFAAQRKDKIRNIMLKSKQIDVSTLSSILSVSEVTVRKDLDKLESEGFLIKTHGGAILSEVSKQVYNRKDNFNIENLIYKQQVVDLALTTIENGDSIFLGNGSTCYLLAKKLKQLENITVVTNNVNALSELFPNVYKVFL